MCKLCSFTSGAVSMEKLHCVILQSLNVSNVLKMFYKKKYFYK